MTYTESQKQCVILAGLRNRAARWWAEQIIEHGFDSDQAAAGEIRYLKAREVHEEALKAHKPFAIQSTLSRGFE